MYGRDRLLFCFAVVQSLCAVRYYSDYHIILRKIKVENTILRFLPLKYSAT